MEKKPKKKFTDVQRWKYLTEREPPENIEESLDNYEKSIYYLELFQKNKNENKVLDKINDIVDDKNLNGFEITLWKTP